MKKILTLLAIALAALTSCKPDEEEISPSEVYLNVYYDDIVFPSDGGEDSFEIESNGDWVISNDADWLTIEPSEGKGSCSIALTASASDLYDDRNTVITVYAGENVETFTVTQKYAEALLVTKNKFDIPQEGGEFTVEVQSNISYEIVIDEDCQSWISEVPQSKALNTYTHTFSVESNQDTSKREGSIEIIGGNGKTETINIYQAQKDELVLSKSEETVPAKGGEVRVQLRSNVDYEVIIPEDVDWVEQIQSDKADELVFNVKPNSETSTREAEITVKDRNSELCQIFTIVQTSGSIVLDETYYEVHASGDTLDIVFTSDVEYEIIIGEDDASWITYEETDSVDSYQHNLRIFVGPNTVNEIRTAEIDIKDKNSDIKATITVRQLTGAIIFEDSWIEADASGETIRVPFATDIEYEVNIPEEYSSWISLVSAVQTKALIDTAFSLKIEPNAAGSRREARIAVKDKYSNLSQTLTIEQDYMRIGVDGKSYTVPARGETLTIRTTSANIEYNVTVPEEFSSWISVPEDDDSTSFKLKIEPNDNIKVRNATINLSDVNGLISEKISIQQEIAEMSLVNRDSSKLNSSSTTLVIQIASNVETELIIPNDAQSWIQDATESEDLDADIKTFTLNISENESSDTNRETEVILKDKYSPMQLKYYILQYNNSEYHGSVLLDSQEDLKAYSKYKRIYGNVTIIDVGTTQALNNQLTEIYGNVTIEKSGIDGLYGLKHIYGNLTISSGREGLNNLETIQGNLTAMYIYESSSGSGEIIVDYDYSPELNLESLTEIGGNCRAVNCIMKNLQSIGGSLIDGPVYLPNLEQLGKDFIVNYDYWYHFEDYTMDLNKLKEIKGDLIISDAYPLDTCPFQNLESIGGNVDIGATSTEGFSNLKSIGGNCTIRTISLSGLTQLQNIGGDFNVQVSSNRNETLFMGLNNLELINGVFTITVGYLGDFSSFDGLNNLTQVGGLCINVTSTSEALTKLTSFKGMESLEKISGDLIINSVYIPSYQNSFKAFTSFDGLNNLREISGNIEFTNIPNLTDLSALGNISNSVKDISIRGSESLYDFSPLVPVVQNMTGIWSVSGCGYNPTKYQMLNGESKPQE